MHIIENWSWMISWPSNLYGVLLLLSEWVYTHIHPFSCTYNNKPEIEILHIHMQWINITKPVDYAHFQGDCVLFPAFHSIYTFNDLAKQKTGQKEEEEATASIEKEIKKKWCKCKIFIRNTWFTLSNTQLVKVGV